MNQILTIGKLTLTTSNVEYDATLKSSYANYPSNTSTNNNAFIDVLDGALLWFGELPESSEINPFGENLMEV